MSCDGSCCGPTSTCPAVAISSSLFFIKFPLEIRHVIYSELLSSDHAILTKTTFQDSQPLAPIMGSESDLVKTVGARNSLDFVARHPSQPNFLAILCVCRWIYHEVKDGNRSHEWIGRNNDEYHFLVPTDLSLLVEHTRLGRYIKKATYALPRLDPPPDHFTASPSEEAEGVWNLRERERDDLEWLTIARLPSLEYLRLELHYADLIHTPPEDPNAATRLLIAALDRPWCTCRPKCMLPLVGICRQLGWMARRVGKVEVIVCERDQGEMSESEFEASVAKISRWFRKYFERLVVRVECVEEEVERERMWADCKEECRESKWTESEMTETESEMAESFSGLAITRRHQFDAND